ncbi:uncharacterized protein UTRI_05709 [Ustilago trichophora]|uniref:Uncharacterized protein n=1 Tax=Ustilago trichophora TaxID=86804 RepID=A0A5C3EJK4_9BASI|nr:uncharacterized protein UTRI_05709 [Ustilago trichophora]
MVSALFVPYMSPTNLHSVPTFDINLITITADICNQTNTNSISHIAMTTPSISKHSTASRAARAADRDQQEAWLQQAAAELGNGTFSSIRKAAAANRTTQTPSHVAFLAALMLPTLDGIGSKGSYFSIQASALIGHGVLIMPGSLEQMPMEYKLGINN